MPYTPRPAQPINITTHNQSGGFAGVNSGTVNLGDPETDARVAALQAELDARKAKEKEENDAREREMARERRYTLFQSGKPVAKSDVAKFDELRSTAFFWEIKSAEKLNADLPFEYQGHILRITHVKEIIGLTISPNGTEGRKLKGVLCEIKNPPLTAEQIANLRTFSIQSGQIHWGQQPVIPNIQVR